MRRFQFQEHPGAKAKLTKVFEGAQTRGRGSKPVIDKQGRITVRYQGIDAPELHYQALAEIPRNDPKDEEKRAAFHKVNKRYRQHWGETAAVKLAEHVRGLAGRAASVPCQVTSFVRHPNEVFDVYGRMIGSILVGKHHEHDLNLWLVEQGWAFPTFYSSMQEHEIEAFLAATKKARQGKRGIWKQYSDDTGHFEWDLAYEKDASGEADKGPVLLPKIFRRVVAYQTNKKAGLIKGSFKAYLQHRQPPEACFETTDFLENGLTAASPRFIYEFLEGNQFAARPEGLVFQEAPSTLVDAKGAKIRGW